VSPTDILVELTAYTTSFDSEDDNNGDGEGDRWGIPEWVAYEVKKSENSESSTYKRPSSWMTIDSLNKLEICPNDATYAVSGTNELKEVSGDYRYVRGHMCPKDVADRISEDAGYNTHTTLNAVPQLQWQNNGIWKKLESDITDWADKYNSVWVVCGPVFFNKTPAVWLGQNDEVKAAVPDALYKIVIRETGAELQVLAFIIPNVLPKEEKDYSKFLTCIDRIEELTGLDFLNELPMSSQDKLECKFADLKEKEKKAVVEKW
jgi:DNA/RNA endonuclease G (NUC1)